VANNKKNEKPCHLNAVDAMSVSAFDVLFDQNPIPAWIFDAATLKVVAANDAACGLYHYTKRQFLKRNVLNLHPSEDRSTLLEAIVTGAFLSTDAESVQLKANGAAIKALRYARKTQYRGMACIIVWNIDITAREQAAAELGSTRIFLDAVVESIPSMVFVKDAIDGRFVLLNKAGEDLLGVKRQDLIGKSDFDMFNYEDAERFRLADRTVVASGKLVSIDNEPLTTPHGLRALRTQKIGVPDIDGKPRYLLGISEDVTEKLRVEERSRHLALHDVLTDLPNRLNFQTILDRQLDATKSKEQEFALLLIDLDRFKAVNDSFGHHFGDDLLRQAATRMQALMGKDDVVARLGGDEFGIIHRRRVSEASASALARRLIGALSEPFAIDGHVISIGCSAGLALRSKHGDSADGLMKRADLALYAAKSTGKGDYAWFEFEMEEKADHLRLLRHELSFALEKNQLFVEYQPIYCTRSNRIVCFEALLRWRHPSRGLISPAEFVPVAESCGLIDSIGRWVLHQACTEATNWPEDISVAVNLSPKQFGGFRLAAEVIRVLDQSGLPPHRLELEITESIFLTDSAENIRILHQLKRLGVRVALDDFGTGYSSLAYLRNFPFDKLKIDRSFITDLTSSPENLAIVRAVIGLGKSFAAVVTAEGVETEAEMSCLVNEGCDQVQGYFLGRPLGLDAVYQKLAWHPAPVAKVPLRVSRK